MSTERERYSHESFGQISFSRINSNGMDFYGSELRQDNYISLTISESEVDRDLSKDWYFAKKEIFRLRMTSGQFSELITSMNQGGGACCTLERIGGKTVESLPYIESRKELTHRLFEDRMKSFSKSIRENRDKAKEIVKKKTLSKVDIEDLSKHLDWLTSEISNNIPYFAKCFQETMDDIVYEAKCEVENAIQHKVNMLGLNELHKQNNLLKNSDKNI